MDSHLLARAKLLLRSGTLPSVERFASYGGPSCGATCIVCDSAIEAGEPEIEVEWLGPNGRQRMTLHPRCQSAWHVAMAELQRERASLDRAGEPAP